MKNTSKLKRFKMIHEEDCPRCGVVAELSSVRSFERHITATYDCNNPKCNMNYFSLIFRR